MSEESNKYVPSFHQRFNIAVSQDEAQNRFVNRVKNQILDDLLASIFEEEGEEDLKYNLLWAVANVLGREFDSIVDLDDCIDDFYTCLHIIEIVHKELLESSQKEALVRVIRTIISDSELDLGVTWRDGAFWPSGAKLLDEALVNENLKWLADKGYPDVLVPFEKGLRHFLEATQKPERLGDTVTDVYEAVEALAKSVTGRDRDLSANAELFISKLNLSDYYKKMLKDYIEYANEYRHAAELGKAKKTLLRNEVEAFIYTSGLFIRLAVQQIQ